MSDLFGNHIFGFPTRRLIWCEGASMMQEIRLRKLTVRSIGTETSKCNVACDWPEVWADLPRQI